MVARRRRVALVVVVGLVVLAGGVWAASSALDAVEDGAAPSTTSFPGAQGPDTVAFARDEWLEVTVTVHADRLIAGERTAVDVEVVNVSSQVRGIGAFGHCGGPGGVSEPDIWSEDSTVPTWSIDSPLDVAMRASHLLPPLLIDPAVVACDASLPSYSLEPGETRSWRGVLDVPVGPQPMGTVPLRVRVAGPGSDADRSDVSVEIALPIQDQPERMASYEEAVSTLASSRVVADLVAGRLEGGVNESTVAVLGFRWRRGMWELELSGLSPAGRLRLRYDPDRGAIVDARIIPSAFEGQDESAPRPAGSPPDIVIDPG